MIVISIFADSLLRRSINEFIYYIQGVSKGRSDFLFA